MAKSYQRIRTEKGIIEATPEHPFWVQGKGWVEAKDIKWEDPIATINGDVISYENEYIEKEIKVYNFSVDQTHSYFAGGFGAWVHNVDCDIRSPKFKTHLNDFVKNINSSNFQDWKKRAIADGMTPKQIQDLIYEGSLKKGENIWGNTQKNWGRYYEEISGTKHPGDPMHAHHLVEKGSKAGAANRKILLDAGINPELYRENFTWAPNKIKGQHGNAPQLELNNRLKKAIEGKSGQDKIDAINQVLKDWAEVTRNRT